jgi:hypothetical protein
LTFSKSSNGPNPLLHASYILSVMVLGGLTATEGCVVVWLVTYHLASPHATGGWRSFAGTGSGGWSIQRFFSRLNPPAKEYHPATTPRGTLGEGVAPFSLERVRVLIFLPTGKPLLRVRRAIIKESTRQALGCNLSHAARAVTFDEC